MQLTKYHVVPATGGWRVVSTLGRTRFDGQVLSWTEACRIRERLMARQAEVYGDLPMLGDGGVQPRPPTGQATHRDLPARRSAH